VCLGRHIFFGFDIEDYSISLKTATLSSKGEEGEISLNKVATLGVIFLLVASIFSIFTSGVLGSTGSFGHMALGTTRGLNGSSGVYVSAFQAPPEANNAAITEIVCAVQTVSGSGFIMPIVYAADGASNQYASRDPSTLLSTGSPVAISPTMEWKHMPLSTPVTVQEGKTYYLGYLSNVGTYPSQDYRNPPSKATTIYEMELAGGWFSYPNPPSQFGKVTYVHAGANILAVYAVYTIGGL
jgi:hypothetical protein